MNAKLKKALDLLTKALGGVVPVPEVETALGELFVGAAETKKAAAYITVNVVRSLEGFAAGTYTKEELTFAIEQARLGAIAGAEAQLLKIKVAVIDEFFHVLSMWIAKLLPTP